MIKTKILTTTMLLGLTLAVSPARASEAQVISLEEAHQLAVKNNPSIKSINESVRQAELLRMQAVTILLPRLSAAATVTRHDQDIRLPMPDFDATTPGGSGAISAAENEIVIQEKWAQHLGITASLTLFDPQSIPIIMAADDNVAAEESQSTYRRNDLLFAVTSAYYSVKSSEEAVVIAEDNVKTALEVLRLATARFELGDTTKVDVLSAEIAVKNAEQTHANAQDTLKIAQTSLAHLIGASDDIEIVQPQSPTPFEGDIPSLQKKALEDRLDVKSLDLQKSVAKKRKGQTWSKWVPKFDATYAWGWDSVAGFADDNDSWRLIFGARWDLLDGGAKIVELKQRESDIMMTSYQLEQLKLDIKEEVKRSYLRLEQAERNVDLNQKQLELAEENHLLAQKQYEQGLTTSLELLDAANTLSNARRSLVLAKLSYDLAALRLNKAAGETYRLAAMAS